MKHYITEMNKCLELALNGAGLTSLLIQWSDV